MKRGEVWTVAGGGDYAGKPRPVVILQDDRFDATAPVTFSAFTSDPTEARLFRLLVEPNDRNGLKQRSRLTVEKITNPANARLGQRLGRVDTADMARLNRAVVVFLGVAGAGRGVGEKQDETQAQAPQGAENTACGAAPRDRRRPLERRHCRL